MTQNDPEPKVSQITIFSDQQCLATHCASNTEDWSWAHCNEHVNLSSKEKMLKNYKKWCLFHLKCSFYYEDIQVVVVLLFIVQYFKIIRAS